MVSFPIKDQHLNRDQKYALAQKVVSPSKGQVPLKSPPPRVGNSPSRDKDHKSHFIPIECPFLTKMDFLMEDLLHGGSSPRVWEVISCISPIWILHSMKRVFHGLVDIHWGLVLDGKIAAVLFLVSVLPSWQVWRGFKWIWHILKYQFLKVVFKQRFCNYNQLQRNWSTVLRTWLNQLILFSNSYHTKKIFKVLHRILEMKTWLYFYFSSLFLNWFLILQSTLSRTMLNGFAEFNLL